MHPVESTCVARMGYDPEREEAHVQYRDSERVYAYLGVPASVYEEFASADSKGTFVNEAIKPRYPVRRL